MKLDRERLEEVRLKVSARDGGTNPKYADTIVNINIQDINDQTPTFAKVIVTFKHYKRVLLSFVSPTLFVYLLH